jgi:hypothetical protein
MNFIKKLKDDDFQDKGESDSKRLTKAIEEQIKTQRLVDFFILGLFLVYVMFLTI